MIVLLYRNIFSFCSSTLLKIMSRLLFFTAQPLTGLSLSPWQISQYTFHIHSQPFLLTCPFFSLKSKAAALLPPMHHPKLFLPLWSILSPSLPGADSCLHTAGYTSHCFSGQHHPAFPGTALRHGRSVQGRGSSHLLCENAWWNIQGGCVLGTLVSIVSSVLSPPETADFQERHSSWHRNTLQNDLCIVLVQWLLAGGCPQPPGTHDIALLY